MPRITVYMILPFLAALSPIPSTVSKPHVINFQSPDLYLEALAYNPDTDHLMVGAFRHLSLLATSSAGIVKTLIHDTSLPVNASFLGLAVDPNRRLLIVVVQSVLPLLPFSALTAYDLESRRRIFLAELPFPMVDSPDRPTVNNLAIGFAEDAYVTSSAGNFIWKVNDIGKASIWSTSLLFSRIPVHQNASYNYCNINRIAYVSKEYLLVTQTNTGKLFKVDPELETARDFVLNKDLGRANGMTIRKDGSIPIFSMKHMWFLKRDDIWE